jgi:hypothetical protein
MKKPSIKMPALRGKTSESVFDSFYCSTCGEVTHLKSKAQIPLGLITCYCQTCKRINECIPITHLDAHLKNECPNPAQEA